LILELIQLISIITHHTYQSGVSLRQSHPSGSLFHP
jgi:hypothetical protein